MDLLKKALTFLGWSWFGFFGLVGLVGLFTSGLSGLGILFLALIFLPPLWKITSRFNWWQNLLGRVAVFIFALLLLVMGVPTQTQSIKVAPVPVQPSPTPTPSSQPKTAITSSPSPSSAPQIVEKKPEPTEPVSSGTPLPEVSVEPSPVATIDSTTPIRESASGSCDCPYDTDSRGRSCGRRSAYSKPGGAAPICYVGDRQ
ncbi:hypothetical protein AB3R30_23775 [Leptolyngbyaceae cyanobacterium UHCC 1019]